MPIYEFYCQSCNTVYNFFSKSVNTHKIPGCPKCKDTPLKRLVSKFSRIAKRGEAGDADANFPSFDEARMQKAMALLETEGEKISEDDPKQAANLMRKLSEAAGLNLGSGMEEALNRLEHGEDPEKIEEEMGDLLAGEEPFLFSQKGQKGGRKDQPRVDDTLYEL